MVFRGMARLVMVVVLLSTGVGLADDAKEIALQRKLDAPLDLTLDKVPLQEAFGTIAHQAGIEIQVDQGVYDALPYGGTTAVSATFRATPLRGAIDAIVTPLSLEKMISGDAVLVRPSAPLTRLGRRAEWGELQLLQRLNTTRVEELSGDWAKDLRTLLGDPNIVMDISGYEGGAHERAMGQVKSQLPITAAKAIELYAEATDKIWWVERGNIELMSQRDWIRRQLSRPIVLSFANAPLDKVVAELGHLSGIRFAPDPGLYAAFPAVSLNSNNGTVQQTLDALAGATSIAYEVNADSISLRQAGKNAVPEKADAIIGRLAVPLGTNGLSFDIFLRESDLSPELNALRQKKLTEAVDSLQRTLTGPEVPATTGPATQR